MTAIRQRSNWKTKEITIWDPKRARRKFDFIETWEQFLTRWSRVRLESEAIAMLHELIKLRKTHAGTFHIPIIGVANFLLFYSEHAENKAVTEKAQQLLVAEVLPDWNFGSSFPVDQSEKQEYLETLKEILKFLGTAHDSICHRPFAGKVLSFLLKYQKLGSEISNRYELNLLAIDHRDLFVRAMIAWRAGYYLKVLPDYEQEKNDVTVFELKSYIERSGVDEATRIRFLLDVPNGKIEDWFIPRFITSPKDVMREQAIEAAAAHYALAKYKHGIQGPPV